MPPVCSWHFEGRGRWTGPDGYGAERRRLGLWVVTLDRRIVRQVKSLPEAVEYVEAIHGQPTLEA